MEERSLVRDDSTSRRQQKDQDYDEDTFFEVGQYIPTVFFAWDGHNGDADERWPSRRSITRS